MTQRTDTYDDEQWQLVPKKVTPGMLYAITYDGGYRAMLAAAPTPPASAQSVEPVSVPREVLAWFNSYKSFVAATDVYNARLAVICARREEFGEFGSADPEYRAMNAAQCEMLRHLPLMFSALCRITAPPSATAVRDAALEEAAKLADEMGIDYFARYKGRPPYSPDCEGRANPYYEGMSDGAEHAADAIRALKSKKEA